MQKEYKYYQVNFEEEHRLRIELEKQVKMYKEDIEEKMK